MLDWLPVLSVELGEELRAPGGVVEAEVGLDLLSLSSAGGVSLPGVLEASLAFSVAGNGAVDEPAAVSGLTVDGAAPAPVCDVSIITCTHSQS